MFTILEIKTKKIFLIVIDSIEKKNNTHYMLT